MRDAKLNLMLTVVGLVSCGPAAQAPPAPSTTIPEQVVTGAELAAQGYGEDPQEIGGAWYDYDASTHAITPKDAVFVSVSPGGELVAMWEVASYYDERGESGVFTLRWRDRAAQGWGPTRELTLSGNVKKDGAQCVAYSPGRQVSCEDEAAALIFRTSWRPVVEAGFAVNNPSIYTTAHFGRAAQAYELIALEATSLEALELSERFDDATLLAQAPRKAAALEPIHSRIGWLPERSTQETYLQLTSSMHLAQWRVESIARQEGQLELTLSVMCRAATYPEAQAFELTKRATKTITLALGSGYRGQLLSLCDPQAPDGEPAIEVIGTSDAPYTLWPDERSFNLFLEQLDGAPSLRPAPGQLLWSWTRAQGIEPSEEAVPAAQLWQGLEP